jgi:hypothetical protein
MFALGEIFCALWCYVVRYGVECYGVKLYAEGVNVVSLGGLFYVLLCFILRFGGCIVLKHHGERLFTYKPDPKGC